MAALQKKLPPFGNPNINVLEVELSIEELVKATRLSQNEVSREVDYLESNGDISCNWRQNVLKCLIVIKGTITYNNCTYISQGKKEFRDNFFDKLKIVSGLILLSIAITTFLINIIDTRSNKREIEKLKVEIQKLSNSSK